MSDTNTLRRYFTTIGMTEYLNMFEDQFGSFEGRRKARERWRDLSMAAVSWAVGGVFNLQPINQHVGPAVFTL